MNEQNVNTFNNNFDVSTTVNCSNNNNTSVSTSKLATSTHQPSLIIQQQRQLSWTTKKPQLKPSNSPFSSNNNSSNKTNKNCLFCNRPVSVSSSPLSWQTSFDKKMILSENYHFHRECFKCSSCDKNLNESETHTLVESKYLFCGNCYMKKSLCNQLLCTLSHLQPF